MKEIRILNLEPEGYSPTARSILEEFAQVQDGPLGRQELLDSIGQFDALIVRLGYVVDEGVLNRATKLRAIASATTGLNHIHEKAAEARGIAVLSLRGEAEFLKEIYGTPEHTWALLLALVRNIPLASLHVKEGGWNRDLFRGIELHGKVLGILGFGRVGSRVAQYAVAFGMEVLAYDSKQSSGSEYVSFVSFQELLSRSDIISLHVPYTKDTDHMVGESVFTQMKKGVILINTSRGEVIDQIALLAALQAGHVAGAALDVLEGEYSQEKDWAKKHPLVVYAAKNPRLLITPHIAGATKESMEKTEIFIAEKLRSFLCM